MTEIIVHWEHGAGPDTDTAAALRNYPELGHWSHLCYDPADGYMLLFARTMAVMSPI